ncbi:MAG: hypothetical protein JXA30_05640 [Deltaproteobacteria bacterium]|nr:hypothetical protein [Deltaproteobacteria bacterium]
MSVLDLESSFRLLVYVPPGREEVEKLILCDIEKTIPRSLIEVFRSFDDVKKRLSVPLAWDAVALLVPIDRADLLNLVALSEFLNGIPVLILLPDQNPETVAIAHQLRPRFLTFIGDDSADLLSVIKKVSENR